MLGKPLCVKSAHADHSFGRSFTNTDLFSGFNSWTDNFGIPLSFKEEISTHLSSSQTSTTPSVPSDNLSKSNNSIASSKGKSTCKKPSKVCQYTGGCPRYSQGGTRFCIAHGGGKRCSYPGCTKSVQGSRSSLCIAHGGGKRCVIPGCDHAARGATPHCVAHGGGARCREGGCMKSAQRPSDFCIAHGGGRRCCVQGCTAILRGGSGRLCQRHATAEPILSRMGLLSEELNFKIAP